MGDVRGALWPAPTAVEGRNEIRRIKRKKRAVMIELLQANCSYQAVNKFDFDLFLSTPSGSPAGTISGSRHENSRGRRPLSSLERIRFRIQIRIQT